jgi:hypothetical protein
VVNKSTFRKISCSEVEQRINLLLDDRLTLTGDRILMAHASSCANCDQMIRDYEIFIDEIVFENVRPGQGCESRNEVTSSSPENSFWQQQLGLLASIAAILVLSFGLLWNSQISSPSSGSVAQLGSISSTPSFAAAGTIATDGGGTEPAFDAAPRFIETQEDPFVRRLVYFQPPTLVELAQTTPTWVDTLRQPRKSNWEQISEQLDPLNAYLQISAELPGFRNFHNSVHVTLNLLHQSFAKPEKSTPDLGYFPDERFFAAI